MNYSTMHDIWEALDSASLDEVPDLLREHAAALELPGEPGAMFVGDGEPHTLIVVCEDSNAVVAFWLVPHRLIDDRLRSALELISGRVFAGAADLKREQWDAAVLVMSALAWEMRDAADLVAWAHDDGSTLPAADIESYWNRWAGTGVTNWSDFARPTTTMHVLRRAM